MIEALIPVGSVVRLAESDFLGMICGFYPDNGEQMYDYLAVPYPYGLTSPDALLFLNEDVVTEVVAPGYVDEQGQEALAATVEMMNAQEELFIAIGEQLEKEGVFEGLPDADSEEEEDAETGGTTFGML